jgi:hypothetical protein
MDIVKDRRRRAEDGGCNAGKDVAVWGVVHTTITTVVKPEGRQRLLQSKLRCLRHGDVVGVLSAIKIAAITNGNAMISQ